MVLVVMNFHRARVNVRLEGVEGIRQRRQGERSCGGRGGDDGSGLLGFGDEQRRAGGGGEGGVFNGLASGHHKDPFRVVASACLGFGWPVVIGLLPEYANSGGW